jgi:hypothetical protein
MLEDSDSESSDILGGIDYSAGWKEEETDGDDNDRKFMHGLVDPSNLKRQCQGRPVPSTATSGTFSRPVLHLSAKRDDGDNCMFQNAFNASGHCTSNHKVERPPLRIHDFGKGRGRSLIATRFITKGDIIYTERAAVATQLPKLDGQIPTLACQNCYRSMEVWTRLLVQKDEVNESESTFPYPELWPVMPLAFSEAEDCETSAILKDKYGRIQCRDCQALFCSPHCHQTKVETFGTCCLETRLLKNFPQLEREADGNTQTIQAPVVLAAVFFLQLVQYYRTHDRSIDGHWFHQLCGDADDLQQLELGWHSKDENSQDQRTFYTLKPLYDYIMHELLHLDDSEATTFSLLLLHSLASKAARNGVGFSTQSPFKAYYAGLLRQSNYGGRSSETHCRNVKNLMNALGKEGLERGMDRDIDELVAPEINALFPLTACCNHSCEPNAQIQSQVFDDSHIDVKALADIQQGEEVCISYVARLRNKFQRQKELQVRYLFRCDCQRCSTADGR